MKLIKSLLLGSAAGLVAVAGAQAADLGVKKPSAVEYVKTCPTYGAGFFVVPGTTSCLKIVGRVRVDYIMNNDTRVGALAAAAGRTKDKNTFRARGYLGFDHRTATEYGLLRTYVRAFFQRDNATGGAIAGVNATAANAVLEYAFIQFGGLTVGRVTPVFEHGWDLTSFAGGGVTTGNIGGTSSIVYVNSIGYTANFGGGFSATVALDSSKERSLTAGAGQAMPDIVAALAYDAAWGSVKLSGAVHQARSTRIAAGLPSTKYGYALQLAGKYNLPFLAKGSNIWLSGVVSEGASSYAGWGATASVGQYSLAVSDVVLVGTSAKATKSWGLAGGIQAFVTPTVWVMLTGTYGQLDPTGARNTIKASSVAGTVGWQPVAGFLIGGEVVYRQIQIPAALTVAGNAKSDVTGRIRFQRDF